MCSDGDSMTRLPYYRDIWFFGPGAGYPGAFPNGLINRFRKRWWGKERLWLCSGGFHDTDGVTIDLKREVKPRIVANAEYIPFKNDAFDFVFIDPPYSEEEGLRLYGTPYLSMTKVLNEAWRVTQPGGTMALLHRLIPSNEKSLKVRPVHLQAVIGVGTVASWTNIRALCVWRKPEVLE